MKLFNNKKGQQIESIGWRWIKFLLLIFVLGFLFITIAYAYHNYVQPVTDNLIQNNQVANSSEITISMTNSDRLSSFFDFTPILIIITLIFGLIFGAIVATKFQE